MISSGLRRAVLNRAGNQCEYCGLSQEGQEATFHIDHVHPVALGGETTLENLALACVSCSLRKGARVNGVDTLTATTANLFHPRTQNWSDHFEWQEETIVGRTSTGRATVDTLQLNRPLILAIRRAERSFGRFPPAAKN